MRLLPLFAALAFAAPVRAELFLVDVNGGGDFTDIQAAVDAAAAGDTLLVLPGSYASFEVDKALEVIGSGSLLVTAGQGMTCYYDPLGSVVLLCSPPYHIGPANPGIRVHGLAAGEEVTISGITGHGSQTESDPGGRILVEDCDGTVFLHDVRTRSFDSAYYEGVGLRVSNCELVVLSSSSINGGAWEYIVAPFAPQDLTDSAAIGAVIDSSSLWVVDSHISGPWGHFGYLVGGPGLDGLVLTNSTLYSARSSFSGGPGGWATYLFGMTGFAGTGIAAVSSVVRNIGGPGNDASGAPGVMLASESIAFHSPSVSHEGVVVDAASEVIELDYVSPSLALQPTSASLGDTLTFDLVGPSGALAGIFVASELSHAQGAPGLDGAFVLDYGTSAAFALATLDAAGAATLGGQVPLQSALIGFVPFFQALTVDGAHLAFSNPTALPILQ